jgi:hypothetical protein
MQNQFNNDEISLMFDAALFERKRAVHQKLFAEFEIIRLRLKDSALHKQFPFPAGTDFETGKISQGENYLGYPWIILDFPKYFNKNAMFAFRTMFWYGHYFSISLLIGGEVLPGLLPHVSEKLRHTADALQFATHEDPWCHDINEITFSQANLLTREAIALHAERHGYIKLTIKTTETDMEKLRELVFTHYEAMLKLLL